MNRVRATVLIDRATPFALKLIAAANLLFLGSFLATLAVAVEIASR